MNAIRNLILLISTVISALHLSAQILVPEDLPASGDLAYLGQSDSRLWAVQQLPGGNNFKIFSVSVKTGNRWDRLPNLYLVPQNNSKTIRITDVEIYGSKIYISGDFSLFGKSRNCLVYTETSGNSWTGDHEFISNTGVPVVNSMAELDGRLYLGGNFSKVNGVECLNMAKLEKANPVSAVKIKQENGAAGVVNSIETDSTKTALFIGGAFRNILGQSISGLVKYSPADSSLDKMTSDLMAVYQLKVAGSKLLIYGATESTKPKTIFLFNGKLSDASGLDSLQEVRSLFAHKNHFYFAGTARLSSSNRETGLFEFSAQNKTQRVYAKFGKILMAESYGDYIHISGSFLNPFTQSTEGYTLAHIDDNFQRFYGRVFYDANNNGVFNQGELRIGGRDARIQPYGILVPVDRFGFFTFVIPTGKTIVFTVTIDKTPELVTGSVYKFSADTFTERLVDFPLRFGKPDFTDVKVNVTAAAGWQCRKDTSELYVVKISNTGLVTVQPDLKLKFNGKLVLIKPEPAPNIIDPGKLTWTKQTLQPGDEKTYLIKLTTPGTDFSDKDQVSFMADLTNVSDDNPANNTDTLTQTVSSGVSPNAKYQYPEAGQGDTVAWLTSDAGKIDYIIRFTNTTTDTLNTVVVRDTISTPDYVTYIQETGSSHPFSRYVYTTPSLPEKVIVAYTFSNINLPPNPGGNTEQVNSSGYVGFRLGLTTNLSSGTDLRNRASIYMDNYSPILTNTVVAVVAATPRKEFSIDQFSVFPNPVSDILYFSETLENGTLRIYNNQGKEMMNTRIQGNSALLDRNMAAGTYFWNVYSENGTVHKGILIKI